MTPRYRCPWCGSFRGSAIMTRDHIMERHKAVLIRGLGLLEAFDTRKTLDPPRNALERHSSAGKPMGRTLNPGVSREGDTS